MKKLLVLFLLIFAVGCTKQYKQPDEKVETPEETVKEEVVRPEEMEGMEEEPQMEQEVVEEIVVPIEEDAMESARLLEEQAKSVFKDVLFDYDRYDIRQEARAGLNDVAAFLNENSKINIVIEGHCDERGTNEYNLALGEKRAKAAKNYLVSLGISPERMIIITFGEEKPVCSEKSESCWQNNRRAHFVLVKSRFQ